MEALEATVTQEERAFAVAVAPATGAESTSEIGLERAAPTAAEALTGTSTPDTSATSTPGEARRQSLYEEVQRLQRLGSSHRAISRELDQPLRTIQRFAQAPDFTARKHRTRPPGQLAPHRSYLKERLQQGCRNAAQLWRELQEQGFTGSYSAVYAWIAERHPRTPEGALDPQRQGPVPTPRAVTWWLVRSPERLTTEQASFLEQLQERCPEIAHARELVQDFFAIARKREGDRLEDRVTRALDTGAAPLRSFALGLRRDWEAVVAGLTVAWSNGPVEGHVDHLKLIKRQMYGRANFALLRGRVLSPG